MFKRSALCLCSLVLTGLLVQPGFAQLPEVRLNSIFPPGGKVGSTVELQITGGTDMDEQTGLIFSHPGIKAVPKMQDVNGTQKPVASNYVVTIDANVPPGLYEVNLTGLFGISNPRTFAVGTMDEVIEQEANDSQATAQEVQVNQCINGRSNKRPDVDYYKFSGKKGQRVLAECYAARIDSRMVATLDLLDANGKRLAHGIRNIRNDPFVDVTLPADGEYQLKIYDFVYNGSNDYVYRLAVHTNPHVDYILPSAGVPGTTQEFTLYGRNLPGGQLAGINLNGRPLQTLKVKIAIPNNEGVIDNPLNPPPSEAFLEGTSYQLKTPQGNSNPIFIPFATAPTSLEQEPNDLSTEATTITVPADITAQFQARRDIDAYQFEAKKGEEYYIEVFAQRAGIRSDAYFVVEQITKDKDGKETAKRLTAQDDTTTNLAANVFDTVSDDPMWKFTVPADGLFRVTVRDRFSSSNGSADLVYRLSIRKPDPGFRLVVVPYGVLANNTKAPAGITLRKGENRFVDVIAYRQDGYDGVIDISVEGLPAGVTCKGASIGAGESVVPLVFTTTEQTAPWQGHIKVVGKSNNVTRTAHGATLIWTQAAANTPTEARLADSIPFSVVDELAGYQLTTDVFRVTAHQGQQILVPVKLIKRDGFDNNVNLTVQGLPRNSNIQVQNKPIQKGKDSEVIRMFVNTNGREGTYTCYIRGDGQVSYKRNVKAVDRAKKEQEAAQKVVTETAAALKTAQQKAAEAAKKVTDTTNTVNQAKTKVTQATQKVTQAAAALKAAQTAKQQADKAVADAKDEAAKKAATQVQTEAQQKLQAAEAASKQAQTELDTAKKTQTDADAALKTAQAEKKTADDAVKAADTKSKAAVAAKKVVDKKVTDATNAAKPKNVKFTPPSTPIVITVKKAPGRISASVPGGGNIKRGNKIEIKVTLTRNKDFKEPVTLALALPPGVEGLTAAPVTIPADKKDGVLVVQAAGNATEGAIANLVIRGTTQYDGEAAIDAPITLKVAK